MQSLPAKILQLVRLVSCYCNFSFSVLFIYETLFGNNSITNFQNQHQWVEENPPGMIEGRYLQQLRTNEWVNIVGGCLIGSFVLPLSQAMSTTRFFVNKLQYPSLTHAQSFAIIQAFLNVCTNRCCDIYALALTLMKDLSNILCNFYY